MAFVRIFAVAWFALFCSACSATSPVECTVPQEQTCNGICTELQSDPANCGACGHACTSGQVCSAGSCATQCQTGTQQCGAACVNLATDPNHCGDCTKTCGTGQSCSDGLCACPGSEMLCSAGCTDTSKDNLNCGACNKACGSAQTCVSSACTCAGSLSVCGTSCFDLTQDPANCGMCGHACAAQEECASSACGMRPFGTGADGPLSVANGTTSINAISSPVMGTAGAPMLTLLQPAMFAAGQTVLIQQSQGVGAGAWELAIITNISGAGVATLAENLVNGYTTGAAGDGQAAQAVVVPQYTTVDVAAGATLTAPAWNGATGGILAFAATGAVTVEGAISMDGQGFRGYSHQMSCLPALACGATAINGFTGESSSGPAGLTMINATGFGVANGSGGGGGTRGQDCASGGGGAYDVGATAGANGDLGVCIVNGMHNGGLPGATAGASDLGQALLFGGAGGEGGPDEDGAYPGGGGNGGGAIVMQVMSLTVTGTVSSNGAAGGNGVVNDPKCGGSGCGMGGGGGGAGGAIRVVSQSATLGTNLLSASGMAGGACTCGGYGPGGTGGNGRIQVTAPTVTGSSVPPFAM